jgi:hypothetical protein
MRGHDAHDWLLGLPNALRVQRRAKPKAGASRINTLWHLCRGKFCGKTGHFGRVPNVPLANGET